MLEQQHRDNLLKLANYLDSLPEDYQHFDMMVYTSLEEDVEITYGRENGGVAKYKSSDCNTIACAAGHGPAAGILVEEGDIEQFLEWSDNPVSEVNWNAYIQRCFGFGTHCTAEYDFLFHAAWRGIDNTHYGAAARIRYFLDNGVPGDFDISTGAPELYDRYRKKGVDA